MQREFQWLVMLDLSRDMLRAQVFVDNFALLWQQCDVRQTTVCVHWSQSMGTQPRSIWNFAKAPDVGPRRFEDS